MGYGMKLTKLSFSVMLLCGLAPSFGQTATPGESDTTQRDSALSEVIVTAQKTAEPLLSVPVPVTAISADTLLRSNLVTLQSYFQSIPNVNIVTAANGAP